MAGFRDFQTGEVLTAANVNDFLAKQSVMKFADATARDTALGTATGGSNALREGMVAYLDDTNEVLAYDGTAWGSLGLPLGTATPTDGQILAFGTATSTWNPTDGGKLVQMVSGTSSTEFSTSNTSFQDTGLSVSITPTSTANTIYIWVYTATRAEWGSSDNTGTYQLRIERATNELAKADWTIQQIGSGSVEGRFPAALNASETAPSTSAHTYKLQIRRVNGSALKVMFSNTPAFIFAMEVAP